MDIKIIKINIFNSLDNSLKQTMAVGYELIINFSFNTHYPPQVLEQFKASEMIEIQYKARKLTQVLVLQIHVSNPQYYPLAIKRQEENWRTCSQGEI